MGDSIDMARLYEQSSALPAAERASASRQADGISAGESTCAVAPHTSPAGDRPGTSRGPILRCGCCGEIVRDVGSGRSTRCSHCHRSLTVPSHIPLTCPRCGHSRQVHLRKLDTQWSCCNCGQPLVAQDLTLTPRHRRASHHRRHARGHQVHAAWAVVAIAMTLLMGLLALML